MTSKEIETSKVLGNRVLVKVVMPNVHIVLHDQTESVKPLGMVVVSRGDGPDINPKIQPGCWVIAAPMGSLNQKSDDGTIYRLYAAQDIVQIVGPPTQSSILTP